MSFLGMILLIAALTHPVLAALGDWEMVTLFSAVIVGIPVGAYFITRHFEKKRSQAINSLMSPHGFKFTEDASAEYHTILGRFKLGQIGRHKKLKNLLISENTDGSSMRLFDCHYTVNSGKSTVTMMQTVLLVDSGRLFLPTFQIAPENVFHRLGQKLGMQDFDFVDYPKFSKMFQLRGEDEAAIREVFTPAVLTTLEQWPKIFIEGHDSQLILYRERERVKPEKLAEFLRLGSELTSVFMRRR